MTRMRDGHLRALRERPFDLLVIGGGITGAGVALDATARGLRVALLDKGDVASGTSSWSTKLVHGGIRYLEQLDIAMVQEGLRERYILRKIAPYLVHRIPFLYPVASGPTRKAIVDAGLWLYDLLAGWRALGLHHRVNSVASRAAAPLRPPWNRGGFSYYDGQTDDARLTLTILLTAVERGAIAATYTEVTGLLKEGGRVAGVRARDVLSGAEMPVRARAVVNATGVWMDRLQRLDDPAIAARVVPSKGAHIVVPRERLPVKSAVIMPKTSDGRVLFAVPWQGRVLIGTTDQEYAGDLDHPTASPEDVAFMLRHTNAYFQVELGPADIIATYAGLRPLICSGGGNAAGGQGEPGRQARPNGAARMSTKDLSRQHVVVTSPSGLVSIGGGKLTTYRVMAHDAVEAALAATGLRAPRRADTAHLPLTGAAGYAQLRAEARGLAAHYGVTPAAVRYLLGRYGTHAVAVLEIIAQCPALGTRLVEGVPYLAAEAVYSARHELVVRLEDILARRMRLLLLDAEHGVGVAEQVARLVAPELGWNEERIAAEVAHYHDYACLALAGYA